MLSLIFYFVCYFVSLIQPDRNLALPRDMGSLDFDKRKPRK